MEDWRQNKRVTEQRLMILISIMIILENRFIAFAPNMIFQVE